MVIFELPKETEQIQILGNVYEVDITDFNIINEIKRMPSMADKFRPRPTELEFHVSQIQSMFAKILGEQINFPKKPPDKTYIMARSLLKHLHDFYIDKQAEYLDIEYSDHKNELERLKLTDSILKNMPKGVDTIGQPDAPTN